VLVESTTFAFVVVGGVWFTNSSTALVNGFAAYPGPVLNSSTSPMGSLAVNATSWRRAKLHYDHVSTNTLDVTAYLDTTVVHTASENIAQFFESDVRIGGYFGSSGQCVDGRVRHERSGDAHALIAQTPCFLRSR